MVSFLNTTLQDRSEALHLSTITGLLHKFFDDAHLLRYQMYRQFYIKTTTVRIDPTPTKRTFFLLMSMKHYKTSVSKQYYFLIQYGSQQPKVFCDLVSLGSLSHSASIANPGNHVRCDYRTEQPVHLALLLAYFFHSLFFIEKTN